MTEIGKRQKPKSVIELLHKSNNFSRMRVFDNNQVPITFSGPPNCWSLPAVTLTCIAIALCDIAIDSANHLVRSVSEGISLLKLTEKSLARNGSLTNIKKAIDTVWVGLELCLKWQDKELCKSSAQGRTCKKD